MRPVRPAFAGVCLLLASIAVAQEVTTLKVEVDVVSVFLSVHDKKGGLIGNLEKADFTVAEEGKEQTIKYFNRESDLPLTIGLLIDSSRSMERLIEVEKRSADQFFAKVLRQKDEAFIISFAAESELLQDFTNSRRALSAALNTVKVTGSAYNPMGTPGPVPVKQKGTVLYEAVKLAADEKMRSEVGRKALIIISDGMDEGSTYSIRDAIEAAQKSDTIIYGIHYQDQYYAMMGGSGEGYLKKMAEETGGRTFHISSKMTLDDIFNEIQQEMRTQYAIGYTPTNTVKDGSYRKLDIRTTNKDYKVQCRKGYYAMASAR
jgi:VWFA-related protein